jgi:AcrR family transcriptional regulator
MGVAERKAREFARREQAILAAATKLFLEDDWQAVTIDRIADAAEIGKGTVYKHFKSKDEVYARLVLRNFRDLLAKLVCIDPRQPLVARVERMIRIHWQHIMDQPRMQELAEYCELGERALSLSPEVAGELARARQRIIALAEEVLQEGVRQGVFLDAPLQYMHTVAWAAIRGSWQLVRNGTLGLDQERYLDFLVDFLIGRLSSPSQVAAAPPASAQRPAGAGSSARSPKDTAAAATPAHAARAPAAKRRRQD